MVQRGGLINEHDRDILPDGIQQPAGVADKAVALFSELDIALAFRAGQNFEQFLADCHIFVLGYYDVLFVELQHTLCVAAICNLVQNTAAYGLTVTVFTKRL